MMLLYEGCITEFNTIGVQRNGNLGNFRLLAVAGSE
jgi:hypothetical protein